MALLLKNNEFEKAFVIMSMLEKEQNRIVGVPRFEDLSLFVDKSIEIGVPTRAIVSIF